MIRFAGPSLVACLLAGFVLFHTGAAAKADQNIDFARDVRPLLAQNCLACHGFDEQTREAGLRLDQRDAAIELGAIVPGEPEESEMIRRIFADNQFEVMPPTTVPHFLTDEEKELLRRWVAEGAEYQPHFAFIPPERPDLPAVEDEPWVRNPIDRFILAELEAAGLEPAPEADRYTLARRLSLDLTGLPPTPEDVEAFVNDPSPDYYENYVRRLMDSQHWGEHRGRYWLDAARYADTHGIHFDNYREIWSYRDWVINAFNQNVPFDQFTIEQLAGDLLPEPDLDQQIATGFNRCNITTNEGGAIDEEYLMLYTRDRTETTSQVWLGLTMGCAVCHDHKFDPVSQEEFFKLSAFFNNTTQRAMDGNIKDTPPVIPVPLQEDRERWFALQQQQVPEAKAEVEARRDQARSDFEHWLTSASSEVLEDTIPRDRLHLQALLDEGKGEQLALRVEDEPREVPLLESATWQQGPRGAQALQVEGAAAELADVADFERDQAFTASAWIKLQGDDAHGAIAARMDHNQDHRGWDFWVQNGRIGMHLIHSWPEDALKVVANEPVPADEWTHVTVAYDGSAKAAGVAVYYNGERQEVSAERDQLVGSTRVDVPLKIGQRHDSEPLRGAGIHDLRIYRRALAESEVASLAGRARLAELLDKPADQRTDEEHEELYGWWLSTLDEPFRARSDALAALEEEKAEIRQRGTVAHVMQERDEPPTAHVLNRGEYDQPLNEVGPGTPALLPPMPDDLPRNRLGFAQWLLMPENPLTARVTVNRFWQELFGTGIVETTGDFGMSGELPSHPELLDWLAVEFRESGWDVKQLFKLMVTSSTYRQAAVITPDKLALDPDNRLLSRGPRFRMDAEMIRDYALASSGILVRKLGGPSVKPYQPDGVWEAVAMIGSNTRNYQRDAGESLYRRSLYTFWKRSAPPASLDIFNAPNRETCTVQRERTNTPLQALVTLNDVQFIEAARHLAQTVLQKNGDATDAGLERVARRVLARPLRSEEQPIVEDSLYQLLAYYHENVDEARQLIAVGESPADPTLDPADLAAWTMLVNQLLNMDEVLNK